MSDNKVNSLGPSPEQTKEIKRLTDLFDLDWEIDVDAQEIRRKPRGLVSILRDFFIPRRHSVFALYWWLNFKHRTELMAFYPVIVSDNMPIPGYPMKYEIVGDWTIRKADLKYLFKGPLARISPPTTLVSHGIGLDRLKSFLKAWWGLLITVMTPLLTLVLKALQIIEKF